MFKTQENTQDTLKNTANVVEGKLILSLPTAISPVVWQMDLDQTKASALEVIHNTEANTYSLNLKTTSTKVNTIATFDDKETAVNALMAASSALESAQGQMRTQSPIQEGSNIHANTNTAPKKSGGLLKILTLTIGIILLLWILITLISSIIRPIETQPFAANTVNGSEQISPAENARQSTGVPVSADDFLGQ